MTKAKSQFACDPRVIRYKIINSLRENYNSVCSPRNIIHLLKLVKLIGKKVNYIGKIIN